MSTENVPYDLGKHDSAPETAHIEVVRNISRVPGNNHYYEKNGLRTEGDGVDHSHYNTVSFYHLPYSMPLD